MQHSTSTKASSTHFWRVLLAGACVAAGTAAASSSSSYQEPFRPQYHFTPEKNWMNDPNGLVFYEGEYHLFYQYNPFGDKWGHMSWGHAMSRDLAHWQHLPLALAEEAGLMIFSGSAVVDWKNSSGFGKNGKPPLVAIYTGHYTEKPLENQHIAYSNDEGRTWTKYAGNPVLDIGAKDFRDPKVQWHEPGKHWIMTVALPTEHKVRFYGSPDLKTWTLRGEFGPAGATKGVWECPDLFPLPIEGEPHRTRWVLIVNVGGGSAAGGSGTQYFIGEFDGQTFKLDLQAMPQAAAAVGEPVGKLFTDFEGATYGDWKASGDAFGSGPAKGTLPDQNPVSGFHGQSLANSYLGGDKPQGTLTSPAFEITANYLSFLIGGGAHPGRTCMNLLVDGRVVRTAAGSDNEALEWASWNVREFRGRQGTLQIVDAESGGWGHINIDQILLCDVPAQRPVENALWADYGPDCYAAVSWSDIPKADGRRIWLGWMSGLGYAQDVPTSPWRSAMTIPRELRLRRSADGLRLVQNPVRELETLRGPRHEFKGGTCSAANEWLRRQELKGNQLELAVELAPASVGIQGLKVLAGPKEETRVGVDCERGCLFLDRARSGNTAFHPRFAGIHKAPLALPGGKVRLRIFVDACSVEVFANDGEVVITDLVFPSGNGRQIEFFGPAEGFAVQSVDAWTLRSVWK